MTELPNLSLPDVKAGEPLAQVDSLITTAKQEEATTEQALEVLNILKTKCLRQNAKPQGHELWQVYAGLRAMLDYVEHNPEAKDKKGLGIK